MVQSKNLKSEPKTIILTGPTAVGKSSLAIEFARTLNLEIINADSVCFYQEFNIGSAKPSLEERALIPHHLIDVAHPDENYHAGKFLREVERLLPEIHARGKRALIVGGSGFYLKSLRLGLWDAPSTSPEFRERMTQVETPELYSKLESIDPVHAKKIGSHDRYRLIRSLEIHALSGKIPSELEARMPSEPDSRFELWVIDRPKEELATRMHLRIGQMLEQGWIEEARTLAEKYPESKTLHSVGYQQVFNYLTNIKPQGRLLKSGILGLIEEIELAHRQLAKQQRTWFKGLKANQNLVLEQDHALLQEKIMRFYQ